jgi:stringent starvation protein B
MTSNRSYLLRAMYEWIADNGMTPYILVDAGAPNVTVPRSAVKDGRVVLNIAARAVSQLDLGKDRVRFMARFSGVSQIVEAPMAAVLAIYAQENGQGMMFPAENQPTPPPDATPDVAATEPVAKKGPHLRVVK